MVGRNHYTISDIEGTLTEGVMWEAIGKYLVAHQKARVHRWFLIKNAFSALAYRLHLIEEQQFIIKWIVRQAAMFKGWTREEVDDLCYWVVDEVLWKKKRSQVISEVGQHAENGELIILASGLYEPMVNRFGEYLEFPVIAKIGTQLEFIDGIFTGRFLTYVCNGKEKTRRVLEIVGNGEILSVFSDSTSDLPLFELTKSPVAVFPDLTLSVFAHQRNWRIIGEDDL